MELHVPAELEAKLNRLAEATGRTTEQLALDLLATSVEHDEWFRREVEKGRASARAGRLLDRDELVARIEKRYRTLVRSVDALETFPNRGRPGRVENTRELVLAPLPFIAVLRGRRTRGAGAPNTARRETVAPSITMVPIR
jgi:predicted transcriptional regulator